MDTLAIGMPGGQELLIILFVVLLLFGAKKLPELSRALGKSLGEFKKGQREGDAPDKKDDDARELSASDEPIKKDD
jgi:sec-independent protein translocase protein TatA